MDIMKDVVAANNSVQPALGIMQYYERTQRGLNEPVIEAVRDGVKHLNIK